MSDEQERRWRVKLHDAVKQRAEDIDHLIQAVKEDLVEQLPLDGHNPGSALKSKRACQ